MTVRLTGADPDERRVHLEPEHVDEVQTGRGGRPRRDGATWTGPEPGPVVVTTRALHGTGTG